MNTPRYPIIPRMSAPVTVSTMMKDVLIALLPTVGMSVYLFGLRVLVLAVLSMGTCVFWQYLYGKICHRLYPKMDASPYVTGLLLTLCVPVDLPLWAVPLGTFFAIFVVKELYGGLGCNFLNPALSARLVLASSPLLMTYFSMPIPIQLALETAGVDVISSATPMSYLHQGQLPAYGLEEVFLGFHSGSLGEVSTLMLMLGGIYLILRRVITPTIPLCFLGTVAFLSWCFPPEGIGSGTWVMYQLCSGGLMLGAFFMATDPVTSPVAPHSQIVFGMGCGMLTVMLRSFGSYPDGVGFAILTMNGLVWVLDYTGAPRRFGAAHFGVTGHVLRRLWYQVKQLRMVKPTFPSVNDSMTKIKSGLKSLFPRREEGTVPGESVLDRLPQAVKSVLAFGIVLIITMGAISWTYTLTLFQAYRSEEAYYQDLLSGAMPQADFMSETPYVGENFHRIYNAYATQNHIGYCVEVSDYGFVGKITLLVGVNLNGAVTGIAVVNQEETLLLGEEALSPMSLLRFYGRSGTLSFQGNNPVDLLSGATVTMEAVLGCVNKALEVVKDLDEVRVLESVSQEIEGEEDAP